MFLLGIQDDGIDAIARGEILKGRVRRMGEMDHSFFADPARTSLRADVPIRDSR